MIHLRKSLCGYEEYTCIGLEQPATLAPIVCDPINYDESNEKRENDNNFLNLPTTFKAVVQNVPFVDLGTDAIWDATKCVTQYQPLAGGLIDAFSYLQTNPNYVQAYGNFKQALQCSTVQQPGILLPSSQLSTFSPVMLQAIPTQALAASAEYTSVAINKSVQSGCSGFKITARITGSYKVLFSVSSGIVYASNDETSGEPQSLQAQGLIDQFCQGKESVQSIEVYLIVGYNIQRNQWQTVIDWKAVGYDFYPDTPKQWIKIKQLGTIKYVNRSSVDVIQAECSPVDIRDWMSQERLPQGTGNYVFLYKGNSAKKEWVQVQDCD